MKLRVKAAMIVSCILFTFPSTTAAAADYTVVTNDSLYKLSQLYKVPVDTLKLDNFLKSDMIYPGQVLSVPAYLYTVKSGDTLFLISKQFGITQASLQKANNKWDSLLMPGQKLIIPGKQPVNGAEAVIPYTQSEVDLLARLIEAEARGETYEAQVGVGGVVVNRVQSSDWPSSISAVINQVIGEYYQFTPVKNGTIKNPASALSVRAAWAAINGKDPSKGALFYFDDSSTNQWMWSKPKTAYIDSMVFVK